MNIVFAQKFKVKVKDHKKLRNLHLQLDVYLVSVKSTFNNRDFVIFCGLFRKHELNTKLKCQNQF